jgi:ligand-binding SRPBCC domain-containing protein
VVARLDQRYGGRLMTVVEASTVVDAPPEAVWRVVSDPRNLPRWDRRIGRVHGTVEGPFRTGSEYETDVHFIGVHTTVPVVAEEVDELEYARLRLGGLLSATVETWLQELPKGRTRLSHRVEYRFRGGLLGAFAAETVGVIGAHTLLTRGIEAQRRQIEDAQRT